MYNITIFHKMKCNLLYTQGFLNSGIVLKKSNTYLCEPNFLLINMYFNNLNILFVVSLEIKSYKYDTMNNFDLLLFIIVDNLT